MADRSRRPRPVPDRARKRAIRAQAARAGVPYSVAARQLDTGAPGRQAGTGPTGGMPASQGRTIYPSGSDGHRRALVESRERRTAEQRLRDARLAADLPDGRARHLADRFPPTRGEEDTGVGLLYHGAGRCAALAALYLVVANERPELVPSAGDLAWEAELGEETAVDTVCARLDRAARRVLDGGAADLYPRVAAAASLGRIGTDADRPGPAPDRLAFAGARQILDAVLVVGEDGHAPGTRVRVLGGVGRGGPGTITGAFWDLSGPPSRYEVRPDGAAGSIIASPDELWVPA